ncbi:MAG: TetR/AcrR family transcriptional regulator [Archangiaceae bacterium]|nr:TetR/AcrR family transcriptional regulator [Archangiaceae bacterium]
MLLDGNRRGSTPGRDRVVGTRETTRCSACTDALEVPPATEDSTAGTVDPTISIETMRFHPLGELACIQLARLARFLDLVLSLLGASRASAVVPPDNYLGPWIPLLVLEVDPSTAARDTSCERGSRKGAVMYLEHGEPQLISAFLDSISDGGVKEMSVDDVARRLGSSRSALYRQFGSWSQMITFGYAAMLEHLDSYVPRPRDDRATEFEAWWSALTDLLGSVKGVGILAMRSLAELHVGSNVSEEFEARQLVSLVQWCATSPAALRATWSLVRAASARKLSAQERLELREIVWLMVGGQLKPGAGEAMEALSEPLH